MYYVLLLPVYKFRTVCTYKHFVHFLLSERSTRWCWHMNKSRQNTRTPKYLIWKRKSQSSHVQANGDILWADKES